MHSYQPSWMRLTLQAIVSAAMVHLIFGFVLGLSVDEAHYALYGLHLDWSYFDHPPLVGWLQAIPVYLQLPIGVIRLIPELLWLSSLLLCLKLAFHMMNFQGGFHGHLNTRTVMWWTSASIVLAPLFHVLGVGLLPDTLLMIFVPCMMLLTLEISAQLQKDRPRDFFLWLLLGLVCGLAGLSKYTAIFFALAIPVSLITWHGTAMFTRAGFWSALLIALICISPVIYWNYQHDWISFRYQLGHGSGGAWEIKRVGLFLVSQIVCYGFLPFMGVVWLLRRHRPMPYALLSFFYIPYTIFALFSGGGGSLPHWTAPAWLALTPFAGIGLAQAWNQNRKFWIRVLSYLQFMLCLVGFTLLFFGGIPGVDLHHPWGQKNPIADLYGWRTASLHLKDLAAKYDVPRLAVQNWTLGSRVGWYARPLPVFILDERLDQFDLWSGPMPLGGDAIVLNTSQMTFTAPVSPSQFSSCELIDTQTVHRLGRDIASFEFLLCKNWQGSQPNPAPSSIAE